MQAPFPVAVARGPDVVFEVANQCFLEMIGTRDVIGYPLAEAVPELLDTAVPDFLAHVYRTGEPFTTDEFPLCFDRPCSGAERAGVDSFVNLTVQALRD